jgi:hypothetical protein
MTREPVFYWVRVTADWGSGDPTVAFFIRSIGTANMTREPGLYWVRYVPTREVTIADWRVPTVREGWEGEWMFPGSEVPTSDRNVEVLTGRLKAPEL